MVTEHVVCGCNDFPSTIFQRFANKPVDQPIGSIACNMLANHWIDTFFLGKNKAMDVWKRLKEHKKLNCKWLEDPANSAWKHGAVFWVLRGSEGVFTLSDRVPITSQSSFNIVSMVTGTFMGRMGLWALLPVKLPITISIILNFDDDGNGVGKCKHTLTVCDNVDCLL